MDDAQTTARGATKSLLLMLVLGASAIVVAFYANTWKDGRRVERVVVEGNRIVGAEEILALADVHAHAPMFELDLYAIERRVLTHHYVRSASVRRDLPDRIRITIQEREPVAVLARGALCYLDAEGTVLPFVPSEHVFDLPVLSVPVREQECVPGKQTTNRTVRDALELLCLAREIDESTYRNISEVGGDKTHGYILYTAERGVPVLLGHDRFGEKLVTLSVFWKSVVARNGADSVEYIDLRFADQVVVRWNHQQTDVHS